MKTGEFLTLLEENLSKELVFEFQENKFVPKDFHITEIKAKHIESVDCGGFSHNYDETVVQLWSPNKEQKDEAMNSEKALKIFKIVDAKVPLKKDTPIYFEWGLGDLATSIYKVTVVENSAEQLVVKLFVPATVCKPLVQLELAQSSTGGGCCSPAEIDGLTKATRNCC